MLLRKKRAEELVVRFFYSRGGNSKFWELYTKVPKQLDRMFLTWHYYIITKE